MQHNQPRGLRSLWELKTTFAIGLLLTLTSCGAKWHLKRAIAKDPKILKERVVQVDTIIRTDSIAVRDTLLLNQYDTIQIIKERVKIKIRRSYDTVQVEVVCPPDTVRFTTEIPVEQLVYVEKDTTFRKYAIACLVLLIFVAYQLRK